jgi:hypothetical protein
MKIEVVSGKITEATVSIRAPLQRVWPSFAEVRQRIPGSRVAVSLWIKR